VEEEVVLKATSCIAILPAPLTPQPLKSFKVLQDILLIIALSDKLYWISGTKPPTSEHNAFYFSVDNVIRKLLSNNTSHNFIGKINKAHE
jgi:hypothetical protein